MCRPYPVCVLLRITQNRAWFDSDLCFACVLLLECISLCLTCLFSERFLFLFVCCCFVCLFGALLLSLSLSLSLLHILYLLKVSQMNASVLISEVKTSIIII